MTTELPNNNNNQHMPMTISPALDNDQLWLVVAGVALGLVVLVSVVVIVVLVWCRAEQKKNNYLLSGDHDNSSQHNLPYRYLQPVLGSGGVKGKSGGYFVSRCVPPRTSSTDDSLSPPHQRGGGETLSPFHPHPPQQDDVFRSTFVSSYPVQPKHHQRHHSPHHQAYQPYPQSLLAVPPTPHQDGSSNTSDEEEAQHPPSSAGRIWFSVDYDKDEKKLKIHLVKARYLKGRGMTYEPRDPFVRVYLLPDETSFQQSRVRKKTLSPRFNETFTFEMTPEEYLQRTVRLSVYDIDQRNVRHSLGHAFIPLDKMMTESGTAKNNVVVSKSLELVSQRKAHIGEIQFSLCCNPYTDRIKVNVMRAKHLVFKGLDSDQADLYVRVELNFGPKVVKSKETSRQKICESPDIFQNFSFGILGKHFDSCSVCLALMVKRVGVGVGGAGAGPGAGAVSCAAHCADESDDDEVYGQVVVGPFMFARGEQLLHWQEMLSNPRTVVERWHSLSEPPMPTLSPAASSPVIGTAAGR